MKEIKLIITFVEISKAKKAGLKTYKDSQYNTSLNCR